MADIVEAAKIAALKAVEATKPTGVYFGTVTSASPLQINVEQKMTLESAQLILSRNVTEHTIEMTADHVTENDLAINLAHAHHYNGQADEYSGNTEDGGEELHHHAYSHLHAYAGVTDTENNVTLTHRHAYTGRKTFIVHNGLVNGDKVILLRVQGGQKYVVLDRVT